MPPILSSQPNIAKASVFFKILAPRPTNKTTKMNTSRNEIMGTHFVADITFLLKYEATTADNFKAAASPIINAKSEKMPTTKPLLIPLNIARIITNAKAISIIIIG